jgi:DNA-directed RNA polymerase specialized sigma24 family protein
LLQFHAPRRREPGAGGVVFLAKLTAKLAADRGQESMSAQDIRRQTPYLRRYARALTGSQAQGDDFVHATLKGLSDGRILFDPGLPARTALFKAFHTVWRRTLNGHSIDAPGRQAAADRRLLRLSPELRTALLLVVMECFSLRETALILQIAPEAARERYEQAEQAIDAQLATDVLIIEDEPIVALDLDRLVRSLGHRVAGVASTRAEAVGIALDQRLGLILADVRLADGSSGLDAARDILRAFHIPVIFITAFPERLLTGQGAEPVFLVAKPFQDATVKALIGQALFFHEPERAA